MATILLIWLYTLVILFLYGFITVRFLQRLFKIESDQHISFPYHILIGAAFLTTLTSLLSLFIRINLEAAILTLIGAVVIVFFYHQEIKSLLLDSISTLNKIHPLIWVVTALALITTLEIATHKPVNSDTGLYHAQAIRWIETFRVVPGLGNLHTRLAFNSSWFVLTSLFSFTFLKIQSFHLTGSVFFLTSLLYFLNGFFQLFKRDFRLSVLLKSALLPLNFYILASEVSSTGTDLPITLLTWIIMISWVELIEARKIDTPYQPATLLQTVILFLLTIYMLTVKLSSLPLLLLPAMWMLGWLKEKRYRLIFWMIGLSLLIVAPWLVRNVFVSGYLIYPQPEIDLFQVEWKIPKSVVIDEREWIASWARYPRLPKEVVLAMPVIRWASTWFSDLTKNRQLILTVIAIGPFLLCLLALAGITVLPKWFKPILKTWKPYLIVALLTYLANAFWFLTVPGIRFGIGFLIFSLLLVCLAGASFFSRAIKPLEKYLPHLLTSITILYLGLTFFQSIDRKTISQRWILPLDYVNLPTAPCSYQNFSIYCATQYEQCGYEPFPCAPKGVVQVGMRGGSYQDGFWVPQE